MRDAAAQQNQDASAVAVRAAAAVEQVVTVEDEEAREGKAEQVVRAVRAGATVAVVRVAATVAEAVKEVATVVNLEARQRNTPRRKGNSPSCLRRTQTNRRARQVRAPDWC